MSVTVVNLQCQGAPWSVQGFGHLVPSSEDPVILGTVSDSVAFPEQDGSPSGLRVTMMLGGSWLQTLEARGLYLISGPVPTGGRESCCHSIRTEWATKSPLGPSTPELYPPGYIRPLAKIGVSYQFLAAQKLPLTLAGGSYEGLL